MIFTWTARENAVAASAANPLIENPLKSMTNSGMTPHVN